MENENHKTLLPKNIKEAIKRQYNESVTSKDGADEFVRRVEDRVAAESARMIINGVNKIYNEIMSNEKKESNGNNRKPTKRRKYQAEESEDFSRDDGRIDQASSGNIH